MKITILLSLLIIGVSIATVAKLSKASDIYRSGNFDRTSAEMTSCVGNVLVNRYPKLRYAMINLPSGAILSGPMSPGTDVFAWTMTTKPTGSKSSRVDFRNKDATLEEIQKAWKLIEWCGKQ